MTLVLEATTTTETTGSPETQVPTPIRIIRNGQWVEVLPSELTEAECRAIYAAAFLGYGW
jgi:hypothetical protein